MKTESQPTRDTGWGTLPSVGGQARLEGLVGKEPGTWPAKVFEMPPGQSQPNRTEVRSSFSFGDHRTCQDSGCCSPVPMGKGGNGHFVLPSQQKCLASCLIRGNLQCQREKLRAGRPPVTLLAHTAPHPCAPQAARIGTTGVQSGCSSRGCWDPVLAAQTHPSICHP